MIEFSEIPILDVSAIHSDDPHGMASLVQSFADAYSTSGFSYIVNHGIDQRLIDQVFDASARFHGLLHAEKMEVELNHLHRGFIPINTSTDVNSQLADVTRPNQSESFMMMREDGPDAPDVVADLTLPAPINGLRSRGFEKLSPHTTMDLWTLVVNLSMSRLGPLVLNH